MNPISKKKRKGKRGKGAGGKIIVFGILEHAQCVELTEVITSASLFNEKDFESNVASADPAASSGVFA